MTEGPDIQTAAQAAQWLPVTAETLRRWAKLGKVRSVKLFGGDGASRVWFRVAWLCEDLKICEPSVSPSYAAQRRRAKQEYERLQLRRGMRLRPTGEHRERGSKSA